jgi:hypothetical protein
MVRIAISQAAFDAIAATLPVGTVAATAVAGREPPCNARFSSMGEIMPSQIAILSPVLVVLTATFGTMVIHGFVVHTIVMNLRGNLHRGVLGMRIWVNMTFVMAVSLLALAGHLGEIALWAFTLDISGAVTDISAAIYSSAGSYTTSGSDIILPSQWKLLGPFEAVVDRVYFRCRQPPDSRPVR